MKMDEALPVLKPFLGLETEAGVATIRLTDDALTIGRELESIQALRGLLEYVAHLPQKAVLCITTPGCFSAERCDALWRHLGSLEGRRLDNFLFPDALTSIQVRREENMCYLLFKWLRSVPKPVIMTFRGEVAFPLLGVGLACDHRIASSDAVFFNRSHDRDVPPATGLLYTLPACIGLARVSSLMMRCREMTAQEALDMGIVDQVVPDEQLESSARLTAAVAAKCCSPNTVAAVKLFLSQHLPPLDEFFAVEVKEVARATVRRPWAKCHAPSAAPTQDKGTRS
jgi:2-(1,2-epoxy-1,2-dihydrophenyl)acetyl-CoA isomerase